MRDAFGLTAEQYAWFGSYPGAAYLISDEDRWKNYVRDSLIESSISKDILMLTRVDKPALLKQLFEIGCLYSGQVLSFTKIVGQLQDAGNTTTLSHYLTLLHTAGLLGGLEKYASDIVRKRSSSPKFQVHNMALMSALSAETFDDVKLNPAAWGRVVESTIGSYLINMAIVHGFNVHYWRHRNEEVDFILEKRGKVVAIEVKTNSDKLTNGMVSFRNNFPDCKILLVGKSGIPWDEFLLINPNELF
jgi:hypothetical protein